MSEGQAKIPQLVRQAWDQLVTIEWHGRVAAFLISRKRLEALAETMELLADESFRTTLKQYRASKLKFHPPVPSPTKVQ